jgi:hypothetical protein
MYLVSLVYASTKSSEWSDGDIYSILNHSQANNEKSGVTGTLCFNGDYFLQCLEGSRSAVNRLYRSIHRDPRHENVILLHYREITERSFDKWGMLYVPQSSMSAEQIVRYSGDKHFDPYKMSGESALQLSRELAYSLPSE